MLVWILPACVLMFVFLYLWTRIPSKSWRFQQSGHSRTWGSPDTLNQGGWVLPWPHGPSVGQEQPCEAPGRCSAEQSSCRYEGKIWAVLTESLSALSDRSLWSQQKFPSAFWGHGHISHCGFLQSRATELILLRSSQLFYQGVFRRK